MRFLTAFLLALVPASAFAWEQHYLVTDRALEHPSAAALSTAKVKVEPIEAFLAADAAELAKLFDEYYAWLGARGSKRFHPMRFDPAKPSREEFLHAARLNPTTRFPLVQRLLPGTKAQRAEVPTIDVLQSSPVSKTFFEHFEDASGTQMSARSVLVSFCDEPDWHMDDRLWDLSEYGYGGIPYGERASPTASQAAFHMLFRHENLVVRLFASELREGMTLDRVELFLRLARLALRTGHEYWGYRFAAWASHYVEDLAQPYHSAAVPSAGWGYYLKFMVSFHKDQIKQQTTQLVKNRHYGYEYFVAHSLQQSYVEKNELFEALAHYLAAGDSDYGDVADANALVDRIGTFAAGHAPVLDRAIIDAYGPRRTEDPSYDIETDSSYNVRDVVKGLTPEASRGILRETGKDFENAGRGMRTILRLIQQAP